MPRLGDAQDFFLAALLRLPGAFDVIGWVKEPCQLDSDQAIGASNDKIRVRRLSRFDFTLWKSRPGVLEPLNVRPLPRFLMLSVTVHKSLIGIPRWGWTSLCRFGRALGRVFLGHGRDRLHFLVGELVNVLRPGVLGPTIPTTLVGCDSEWRAVPLCGEPWRLA